MQSWWNSIPGRAFRTLANVTDENFKSCQSFAFEKADLGTKVLAQWKKGENPSIASLEKYLNALNITDALKSKILNETRHFKASQHEKLRANASATITSGNPPFTQLVAVINEYEVQRNEYWIHVYNEKNQFVYGETIRVYGYGPKLIQTPKFRDRTQNRIGHNNFDIKFDATHSIPERHNYE